MSDAKHLSEVALRRMHQLMVMFDGVDSDTGQWTGHVMEAVRLFVLEVVNAVEAVHDALHEEPQQERAA